MGLVDTFNATNTVSNLTANTNSFTPTSTSAGSSMSAGAGLSIFGSVLQLGSQIYGGILQNKIAKANASAARAQGNYDSAVQEFNAAVARANAEAIRASADIDIERQKAGAKRVKSTQIAGYAKAGVKLTGSPLEVMIDSAQQAKLDIAITDYNAKVGIMQAQSQAKGFDKSAQISKSMAETSSNLLKTAGKFERNQKIIGGVSNFGTSLLSTVSSYSR